MNNESNSKSLTAVAMSGGVDSSVVAAILQESGFPVVGLNMQLWNHRRLPELDKDGARFDSPDGVPGTARAASDAVPLTMCTTPSGWPSIWACRITW